VDPELKGSFGPADWAVVLAVLLLTTWIGHRKAGKQGSLRDFFLGGRRLPWYAVAASIVATEISAVTFISLSAVVWRPGGDLTYLQLGLIGSLLAKAIIGFVLVPAYFEREIYSPYDYMGARLGPGVRATATWLFSIGGVLGQSARVYLTAVVLEVVLAPELAWVEERLGLTPLTAAVGAIGLVAVGWTWMGGIATVVWTDAILFLLFVIGALVVIAVALEGVPGGAEGALQEARAAGRLRLFDPSLDPTRAYTLWAALIASTWGMVGFYGTDQLIAQRLFCCRDARDARRAILASYAAMLVTCLVAGVGIALAAFTEAHPLEGKAADLVAARPDRILPVFLVERVPSGLKGLVVAGVFAAAISSLDSILAALSQTTLSAWGGLRRWLGSDDARAVRGSRLLVAVYALLLCFAAVGMDALAGSHASILDLALAMASYTGGALIAGFFLAFLPLGIDGSGYPFGAALSVLVIAAVTSHQPWREELPFAPEAAFGFLAVLLLGAWVLRRLLPGWRAREPRARLAAQTALLVLGLAALLWTAHAGCFPRPDESGAVERGVLAWPWYLPLGSAVAFLFGWMLARPREG
jgi:SSS family solute:Na+ symporter